MYKSLFVPYSTHADQTPALLFASELADAVGATAHCAFASKSLDWLDEKENARVHEIFRKEGYIAAMDLADKLYAGQFEERVTEAKGKFEAFVKEHRAKHLRWNQPLNLYDPGAAQMQHEVGFYDLTVMSSAFSDTMYDHVINAALFGTGRPLALIRKPIAAETLKKMTVLLAWKNTPQALRAQWFALPILKLARKVVVAHAVEEDSRPRDFERVTEYLKAHGIAAEDKVLYGTERPETAMEKAYADVGAELLVMGAYSHTRWREMVMGGFTRHFLKASDRNLFLAH